MKNHNFKESNETLDISSKEFNDLNHSPENNIFNSLNDLSEEISFYEILKLIENPDEHINSELPFILENLINSKRLDETNTNSILIADLSRIFIQHLKWTKCFPFIKPYYKIETNNNSELLKVIEKLGINFICGKESEINDICNIENNESQYFPNVIIDTNSRHNLNKKSFNNNYLLNKNLIRINEKINFFKNNNNFKQNSNHTSNYSNESFIQKIIFDMKNLENENSSISIIDRILTLASEKKINTFICKDLEEIQTVVQIIPSAYILLKIRANDQSEITRSERKRISEIFEGCLDLELSINMIGISLDICQNNDNNSYNENYKFNKNETTGDYLHPKKIYDFIKRAREIFDEAEEYGIEMKIFDIGSPEKEAFFKEENIRLLSDSIEYFFSDLKIEFISQLGKFLVNPAFILVQRNKRETFNFNLNENLNNIINEMNNTENNNIISNSNSGSCFNLAGLNSTEISVNENISDINQNYTYYFDLDLPLLEENNNLGINNIEDNNNINYINNFPKEFILNTSSILDTPTSNYKENIINLKNDLAVEDNLNKFLCTEVDKNFNDYFENKGINKPEDKINKNLIIKKIKNDNNIKKLKDSSSLKNKDNKKDFEQKYLKSNKMKNSNFESKLNDELKKIECATYLCLQSKLESFQHGLSQNIFEDWIIFENIGSCDICKTCISNGYVKPEIYYINNVISLKLEKYFYCIMNKFDS